MVVNAKSVKIVYGPIPQAKNAAEPLLTAIARVSSLLGLAEASVACFIIIQTRCVTLRLKPCSGRMVKTKTSQLYESKTVTASTISDENKLSQKTVFATVSRYRFEKFCEYVGLDSVLKSTMPSGPTMDAVLPTHLCLGDA